MSKKNRSKNKKPKRRRKPSAGQSGFPAKNRIARKRPIALDEEPSEDVAVFDSGVRESLPPELAEQAELVADALQLVSDGRDAEAADRLRAIPRKSVFSEWRLFIRGLSDWYAGSTEAATDCWTRLDPQRRPARIAAAFRESEAKAANADARDLSPAADLVYKVRVSRPAIREAAARLINLREPRNIQISDNTVQWLKHYVAEYRHIEPALVSDCEANALNLACDQPYVDVFSSAIGAFRGPAHDPKHSLRRSRYREMFEEGKVAAEESLRQYLEKDLSSCTDISEPLRNAIASSLHLEQALEATVPPAPPGLLGRMMREEFDENVDYIEAQFKKAIKAYPSHSGAHREFTNWLRQHAEDEDASKAECERFNKKLAAAMEGWSKSCPDDSRPRLWLHDYLLENERLEEARPHVEWLAGARAEDPLVRAAPWKWELLEAMRLCRRKAWLKDVPQHLDAAEATWPEWLPNDWLPYLRAALALRRGDTEDYRQQREALTANGESLRDAIMMLSAAQRMRVPSADLKPLRVPVEQASKAPSKVPTEELLAAGAFLWDLHRVSLLYPAYRMHGSKLGRELVKRMKSPQTQADPNFEAAILWLAESAFHDGDAREIRCLAEDNPRLMGALLRSRLSTKYGHFAFSGMEQEIESVKNAASHDPDRFYRHWLKQVAEECEDARKRSSSGSLFGDLLDNFLERYGDLAFGDIEDEAEEWDDSPLPL